MKKYLGLSTMEAMNETGLSTFRFRKIVQELKLSPHRNRGESFFTWSFEEVKLISEFSKIYYKEKNQLNELEIIEYYLQADNIHQVALHFKKSYHIIERVVFRYMREKCVIVESKIREYE